MPSWIDPLADVVLILLVGVLAPFLAALIGGALRGDEHPMKRLRFESGNPPVGTSRGFFSMQYYPYLLMFVAMEPYAVFLFLASMAITREPFLSAAVVILGLALALPSYEYAKSVAKARR